MGEKRFDYRRGVVAFMGLVLCLATASCGYTFQGTRNPLVEREGIRAIYVKPFRNDSYKAGAEILVYNSVLKALASGGRIRLVSDPDQADAILEGTVMNAQYRAGALNRAFRLFPGSDSSLIPSPVIPLGQIQVPYEYVASLTCSFRLVRTSKSAGDTRNDNRILWSSSFGGSARFTANDQLGIFGNTSPLINETEFDRTLADVAKVLSRDLHESMLAMF